MNQEEPVDNSGYLLSFFITQPPIAKVIGGSENLEEMGKGCNCHDGDDSEDALEKMKESGQVYELGDGVISWDAAKKALIRQSNGCYNGIVLEINQFEMSDDFSFCGDSNGDEVRFDKSISNYVAVDRNGYVKNGNNGEYTGGVTQPKSMVVVPFDQVKRVFLFRVVGKSVKETDNPEFIHMKKSS